MTLYDFAYFPFPFLPLAELLYLTYTTINAINTKKLNFNFNIYQSAYRAGCSTETALQLLMDRIFFNIWWRQIDFTCIPRPKCGIWHDWSCCLTWASYLQLRCHCHCPLLDPVAEVNVYVSLDTHHPWRHVLWVCLKALSLGHYSFLFTPRLWQQ